MDPKGDIYPCIVMNKILGNIKDFNTLEDIFRRPEVDGVRELVRLCKADCWMVCNTRSLIISHPGRSLFWVMKNKPRAHLSRTP
jgi:MoaA/NifB/PqqE/SkfB family radical SAM enzyme